MRFGFKISDFHEYFEVYDYKLSSRKPDHIYQSNISDKIYYYYIRDDIYQWLKNLNIEYYIEFDKEEMIKNQSFLFIEMPDEIAVLFKLTWM